MHDVPGWYLDQSPLILGFLPGGSDRQWRPESESRGRKKSWSSCMHLSDCLDLYQRTPRGSAAGSDAWSSISSGKEKIGEDTEQASQKGDTSTVYVLSWWNGNQNNVLCLLVSFFLLLKVIACRRNIKDIDWHVRCHPAGCWWAWECRRIRFASSTGLHRQVSLGGNASCLGLQHLLALPPTRMSCGTHIWHTHTDTRFKNTCFKTGLVRYD